MTDIKIQSINAATGETVVRDATAAEIAEIEALRNAPPPVPSVITRRQLLIALAAAGLIDTGEALAAAKTGEVPVLIDAFFSTLPPAQQTAARITWATMTRVERNDPLIQALITNGVATSEQVDDLFRTAAQL
jgi:hypothetical protein